MSKNKSLDDTIGDPRKSLPFLNNNKYELDLKNAQTSYFRIDAANSLWKNPSAQQQIWNGLEHLNREIVEPMNEIYDHNVTHEAKLTNLYAKVACKTPGCKFEVWYKTKNNNETVQVNS